MLGGRSIQLARVFGIRIGVNPSWFIVLFLIIWSLSDQYKDAFPGHDSKSFALATVSALLLFFCVILHELGHALVAMRNRIRIIGIDLWLFGGIATMADEPQTPGVAFRITAAGPIVTVLIAGGCWLIGIAGWGLQPFWHSVLLDERFGYSSVEVLFGYLAFINTLLLVFNLLPAFPLDGGNIVRAIAWWRTGDRLRGTRIAARLGRVFGYLIVAAGVYVIIQWSSIIGGIWFIIMGNFLAQAARSTEMQTRITSHLDGLSVADVMDHEPVAVPSETKLDRALDEFFLRYRWQWFPVIDRAGRFLGLVLAGERGRGARGSAPRPDRGRGGEPRRRGLAARAHRRAAGGAAGLRGPPHAGSADGRRLGGRAAGSGDAGAGPAGAPDTGAHVVRSTEERKYGRTGPQRLMESVLRTSVLRNPKCIA